MSCLCYTHLMLPCLFTPFQGHAVKRGMQVARGELLLLMDADGATRVSDMEKLEAELARVAKPGQV